MKYKRRSQKKAFKSRLKELVEQKYGHMTHEEIAKQTGIHRPTITLWMGDRPFALLKIEFLQRLARFLECEINDLYEVIDVDDIESAAGAQ